MVAAAGGFLPPVIAEILAKTDEFTAEMSKARAEMTATTSHGTSSFTKLASLGKAAFIGLGVAAIGVGVESMKMADEFEGAHARLEGAIHNSGSSFEKWSTQIDATDKKLESLGFNNTTAQDSIAKLTNATHDTGKSLGLMGLAADIARGRNIGLSQATDLLIKVETGHVSLLGKMGINVKDATGQTISQTVALQRLSSLYGGDASRYAKTFSGEMQKLSATVQDIGIHIGLWLIPKVQAMGSALAATVGFFAHNTAAAYALAAVIGGPLVVAMGAFVVLKVQAAIVGITKAFDLLTGAAARAAAAEAAKTAADTAEAAAATADAGAEAAQTTATLADSVAAQMAAVSTGSLATAQAADSIVAATNAAAMGVDASAYLADQIAATMAAVAVGTKTAAEGADAIAASADTAATLSAAAAEGAQAAAAATAAAAVSADAAANVAAEAGIGLGAAAEGAGGFASALGLIGPAAVIALPLVALFGAGMIASGNDAKHASRDVNEYASNLKAVLSKMPVADQSKFLAQRQQVLGQDIDNTKRSIAYETSIQQDHSFRVTEMQRSQATGRLRDLNVQLRAEKAEYASLTASQKQESNKQTADHAKAVAEQSAATAKAIQKEKAAVATELGNVGSQYGAYNAQVLRAEGLSSTALKNIEKNVKSAVDATDSAISGFTDVVGKFGDTAKVSAKDILGFFTKQVTDGRKWASDMKTLAKDGIDQGLIQQLYQAGPKSEGLVKGILQTISKGGKDQLNVLISQSRALETDANTQLSSIMIQGQQNYEASQAWFRSHPLVIQIAASGNGVVLFNTVTGQQGGSSSWVRKAAGGVVSSPTYALIGEAGAEAVVPLTNPRRAHEVMAEAGLLGDLNGSFHGAGGSSGSSSASPIVVNIDASGSVGLDLDALGRVTEDALHRLSQRNGGIRVRIRS